MRKTVIVIAIVAFIGMACEKDDNKKPEYVDVTEQQWFKDLQVPCDESDICKLYINKGLHKGDTVYYTSLSGPLCDAVFSVVLLNVYGEVVKNYDATEMQEAFENLTHIETLYRCDE